MQNLVKLMSEQKISQSELHRRSGVSQSHISAIVRDKKTPTIAVIKKLAVALGVSISKLLEEEGDEKTA